MNFLTKLFREIAFVPLLVLEVERMLGQKSGADEEERGATVDADDDVGYPRSGHQENCGRRRVSGRLGKVIDGVVQCLNASAWAKKKLSRGSALAAGGCGLPERSRMVN